MSMQQMPAQREQTRNKQAAPPPPTKGGGGAKVVVAMVVGLVLLGILLALLLIGAGFFKVGFDFERLGIARPFVEGFSTTLLLTLCSGLGSVLVGALLAVMAVSPIPVLVRASSLYVRLMRNVPLLVVFLFVVFGLPRLGVFLFQDNPRAQYFTLAVITMVSYTCAFVCEAIRSGFNTVPPGQAEAARAIGMNFTQTLGQVVLPQAFRAVVPPLGSTLIAMTKNTAIAGGFSVAEATSVSKPLVEQGYNVLIVFGIIAVGYLCITLPTSRVVAVFEKKAKVIR